jgi:predicted amidohydrolase
MFRDVKAAAISFVPKKFGLEQNAATLERMFRRAAGYGAELAVAPEGALEGYVAYEICLRKHPPKKMLDVAVTMNSPVMRRFKALARELQMCLSFGLAERIGEDVYNCAVFIDHNGRLRGKYHKMQLAEGSHASWWWNRLGKSSRAVNTPFGPCGFLICNDRWNADIARIPILDGARYLIIPSYGVRGKTQDDAVLARARENGVPIVEANVGKTLLISKGEIVRVSSAETTVIAGTISIPAGPSPANRNRQEKEFLDWRETEMKKRYKVTRKRSAAKPKK